MEEFFSLFSRLCKENGVDPQEGILQKLKSGESKDGTLDFSNHTLTVATCSILAKVFSHDLAITRLLLADCMLNEIGLKKLLSGLSSNTVIRTLDLRGNNLRQAACDALGDFLKKNQSLENLLLEWNSLGIWEASFAAFCEGLSTNISLQHLDLRNNQIDHKGASELAIALRRNRSLRTLDVRWNNIGLIGGRALSEGLESNGTVVKVQTGGNNIPQDVGNAIQAATFHNEDKMKMSTDSMLRSKTLSKEIEFLKSEKKKQMLTFMEDLELHRSQLDQTNRSTNMKISNLQETLEERKAGMNALRAKLDMCEAALAMSEQRLKDQTMLLEIARKDNQELVKNYENQTWKERDNHSNALEKLNMELDDTRDELKKAVGQISDLERKGKNQADEISRLKEINVTMQTDHRLAMSAGEERLASERRRLHQEAKDQEEIRAGELHKMKKEVEEVKACADQRVGKITESKNQLLAEVEKLNSQMCKERSDHDEAIRSLRKQLKEEEAMNVEKLNERVRGLIGEKCELQQSVSQANGHLAEEKSSRAALAIECSSYKKSAETLKHQLETKDLEAQHQIELVRAEMRKREQQMSDELQQVAQLRERLAAGDARHDQMSRDHREQLQDRERTIEQLRDTLRKLDAEAERAREDENARLAVLHSAVVAYMQGAKQQAVAMSPRR